MVIALLSTLASRLAASVVIGYFLRWDANRNLSFFDWTVLEIEIN